MDELQVVARELRSVLDRCGKGLDVSLINQLTGDVFDDVGEQQRKVRHFLLLKRLRKVLETLLGVL